MGLGLLDFCLKTGTSKSRARIQDYTLETSGLDYQILKFLRIRFMPSSRVFVFFFFRCAGSSLWCTGVSLWWLLLWCTGSRLTWQLQHRGLFPLWHVGSSYTRDPTHVSCCVRQILKHWSTREALSSVSSVAQSCPTLCDPMNCSTPGLPVHHQLPEFTQTHVHQVSDAIQPSHPLSSPSRPAPNPSQHQGLFQ